MNISASPSLRWFAAGLVLMLASCGIVPEKTEISVYHLQPSVQADAGWPHVDTQLVVLRPNAERLVNSARIMVRPTPGEVQVYKGATWSQPAPDILQDAIVRTLEDSRKLAGVTRRGGGIAGDFDLALDIRRFDADYAGGGTPSAVIEVSANLIHNDDNRVVATQTFRHATPAGSTAIVDVHRAFEQSLSDVTRDISGWTLTHMQRAGR
ncbi:ABC-type transport auxiliary lipoprotein family protein [Solilutibacter tolerans]|uniref:Cholesterol transport system auxiliary component n=1 Tax=Solilutibacter tolerans TaxID=1604334 RepID=A0A1N6N8Y5_9GAMM|nr:ABC-type transport auxiliary lipoprotein family protein [Lysobacter tolerans]SIP88533.1 cholesterol transport system auxiliary component [Lysobacter tolerans]